MANDLQMEISADVGKALSGISSVENRVKQLERSTNANNRATQDFQRVSATAFRGASGHAEDFFSTIREGGHALKFMGGEVGEVGHKVSLLARLTSGGGAAIGVLGAAATVGAIALEAYSYAMEKTAERTKKAVEITKTFTEAVEKGKEQRSANAANAGLSQADTIRKLNGAGGHKALMQADEVARSLGIPLQAAREGVLKSFAFKDEKERATAIEASKQLHLSGLGDFGGFDAMHKSHTVRALIRQGNPEAAAGEMGVHDLTGRYAKRPLAAENALAAGLGNNSDNSLLSEGRFAQGVKNETQLEQERRASRGAGRTAVEEEARKALDPIGNALGEATKAVLKLVSVIENPYDQASALNAARLARFNADTGSSGRGLDSDGRGQ